MLKSADYVTELKWLNTFCRKSVTSYFRYKYPSYCILKGQIRMILLEQTHVPYPVHCSELLWQTQNWTLSPSSLAYSRSFNRALFIKLDALNINACVSSNIVI
jgi:hypothetical protein